MASRGVLSRTKAHGNGHGTDLRFRGGPGSADAPAERASAAWPIRSSASFRFPGGERASYALFPATAAAVDEGASTVSTAPALAGSSPVSFSGEATAACASTASSVRDGVTADSRVRIGTRWYVVLAVRPVGMSSWWASDTATSVSFRVTLPQWNFPSHIGKMCCPGSADRATSTAGETARGRRRSSPRAGHCRSRCTPHPPRIACCLQATPSNQLHARGGDEAAKPDVFTDRDTILAVRGDGEWNGTSLPAERNSVG